MTKKYFVWEIIKENNHFYSHPNTFATKKNKWAETIDVEETALNNGKGSYIGIMTVDDKKSNILFEITISDSSKIISKEVVSDCKITKSDLTIDYEKDFEGHDYKYLEPEEVVKLLNNWYPSDVKGEVYFSLDKDCFTLIDDRIIDLDIEDEMNNNGVSNYKI